MDTFALIELRQAPHGRWHLNKVADYKRVMEQFIYFDGHANNARTHWPTYDGPDGALASLSRIGFAVTVPE